MPRAPPLQELTVNGTIYPLIAINLAVLRVAQAAVAQGVAPLDLQFHAGTTHVRNCWLEFAGTLDAKAPALPF